VWWVAYPAGAAGVWWVAYPAGATGVWWVAYPAGATGVWPTLQALPVMMVVLPTSQALRGKSKR